MDIRSLLGGGGDSESLTLTTTTEEIQFSSIKRASNNTHLEADRLGPRFLVSATRKCSAQSIRGFYAHLNRIFNIHLSSET